jgi:hypothetical protein
VRFSQIRYSVLRIDRSRSILDLNVAGKAVKIATGSAALSAIDTGTTLIGGPTADVNSFWASVPGSQPLSGQNVGYFTYRTSILSVFSDSYNTEHFLIFFSVLN